MNPASPTHGYRNLPDHHMGAGVSDRGLGASINRGSVAVAKYDDVNELIPQCDLPADAVRILNLWRQVSAPEDKFLRAHRRRNFDILVQYGLLRPLKNGSVRMGIGYGDMVGLSIHLKDQARINERLLDDARKLLTRKTVQLKSAGEVVDYLRAEMQRVKESKQLAYEEKISQYKTRLAETREHLEKLVNDTSDLDREQEIYCLRAAITAARPGYLDSEDWTRDKAKRLGRERSIKRADQPNIKPRHSLATVIQWLRKTAERVFVSGGGHV